MGALERFLTVVACIYALCLNETLWVQTRHFVTNDRHSTDDITKQRRIIVAGDNASETPDFIVLNADVERAVQDSRYPSDGTSFASVSVALGVNVAASSAGGSETTLLRNKQNMGSILDSHSAPDGIWREYLDVGTTVFPIMNTNEHLNKDNSETVTDDRPANKKHGDDHLNTDDTQDTIFDSNEHPKEKDKRSRNGLEESVSQDQVFPSKIEDDDPDSNDSSAYDILDATESGFMWWQYPGKLQKLPGKRDRLQDERKTRPVFPLPEVGSHSHYGLVSTSSLSNLCRVQCIALCDAEVVRRNTTCLFQQHRCVLAKAQKTVYCFRSRKKATNVWTSAKASERTTGCATV